MIALLPPCVRTMTASEFGVRHLDARMELVCGVPVENPVPHPKHRLVCNWIAYFLTQNVVAHDVGRVLATTRSSNFRPSRRRCGGRTSPS